MSAQPIAVIGMAVRLPGADTPEQYWRDVREGVGHVHRFTDADFAAAGLDARQYGAAGFVGASARIGGVDRFDARFFGMNAREAARTDPQHRLLLQASHHALEDAGYARPTPERRIGMVGTVGYALYSLHLYQRHNLAAELDRADWVELKGMQVGTAPDYAAQRVAYLLNLTGPVHDIADACASGLAAVHLACQALRAGEADLMIAGAAAVHLPQVTGHQHAKGSILSPTGAVRAFDADADGTVGGNGVVAVVLRPLDAALRDGDTVHAVIRGSAVTNDGGGKRSFAAPSVAGQRDAMLRALAQADVPVESLAYLEAHGTGTFKGDPIEFDALTAAVRTHTDRVAYCALGSTKPAIGHLDRAAGLAGFVKAVLAVRHAVIPPLVNFRRANPLLDVAGSPFTFPTAATPWPVMPGPRRAGVHSVGLGGTNAHLILEQAPPPPPRPARDRQPVPLIVLSARHPEALREGAAALADRLDADPPDPADLVTSLAVGRPTHRHRLVVTADPSDPAAVSAALTAAATTGAGADVVLGSAPPDTGPPARFAFLFSGQGRLAAGAGRDLARRFPLVAKVLDECVAVHRAAGGGPELAEALLGEPGPWRWGTELAQPALFALQAAQLRLWRASGVRPDVVGGHSVGEYAALHAAGALELADAMTVLTHRGRIMARSAPGAMLAVFAEAPAVADIVAGVPGVELALVNGPRHHVLAGRPQDVDWAEAACAAAGLTTHRLPVDRAFHSALLDPVLPELTAAYADVTFGPTTVAFVSGLDGRRREPGWVPDAEFLTAQTRRPVDFAAAVAAVHAAGPAACVELGPTDVLTGLVRRLVPDLVMVPTCRDSGPPAVFTALATLHCHGADLDWDVLLADVPGRRVSLPGYAFRPDRHWVGPPLPPDPAPPRPVPPRPVAARDELPGEDSMTSTPATTTSASAAHAAAVLARVAEMTARHLGYPADELDLDETFVGLGADSLQLIGLLRQWEAEFAVPLALAEVMEDASTPRRVAGLVADRGAPASGATVSEDAEPSAAADRAPAPQAAPAPPATTWEPFPAPDPVDPAAPVAPASPVRRPESVAPVTRAEFDELVNQVAALAAAQNRLLEQVSAALQLRSSEATVISPR